MWRRGDGVEEMSSSGEKIIGCVAGKSLELFDEVCLVVEAGFIA